MSENLTLYLVLNRDFDRFATICSISVLFRMSVGLTVGSNFAYGSDFGLNSCLIRIV